MTAGRRSVPLVTGGVLALLLACGVLLIARARPGGIGAARPAGAERADDRRALDALAPVTPEAPRANGPVEVEPPDEAARVAVERPPAAAHPAVSGVVRDCNGLPLEGIGLLAGRSRQVSDEAGKVRFEGFQPGEAVQLRLDPETLPEGLVPAIWERDDGTALLRGSEESRWVEPGVSFVLELSSGVAVRGLASGPGGSPLRDVQVSLSRRRDDGRADPVEVHDTDAEGRFETAALPAGAWRAQVHGAFAPNAAVPDPVLFELRCGQTEAVLELRFDQGLGQSLLFGQAVKPGPGSFSGLLLGLWRDEPGLAPETRSRFQPKASGPVDPLGLFVFVDLAPGDYLLGTIEGSSSDTAVWIPAVDLLPLQIIEGDNEVEWIAEHAPTGTLSITIGGPHEPSLVTVRRSCAHRPQGWVRELELLPATHALTRIPAGELEVELVRQELHTSTRLRLEPGLTAELALVAGELVLAP